MKKKKKKKKKNSENKLKTKSSRQVYFIKIISFSIYFAKTDFIQLFEIIYRVL